MTEHEIKIQSTYFIAVARGEKTFEVRYNDRGYQKGDMVTLAEVNNVGQPTGQRIKKKIGFVTGFEQKESWVVFSLLDLDGSGQ